MLSFCAAKAEIFQSSMHQPATKSNLAPAETATGPRVPRWLPAVLLALMTILAYQPVWHAGFIWDDDAYVTNNPLLTAPDGLWRIWFSLDSPSQYFPLTYTIFRIEHAFWEFMPAGYHWVNILLHSINALLLWRLLQRLNVPGAWLAAAIFALHPVQVESVAWVTELKSVLSLFFVLLALLAWVEFIEEKSKPSWHWYLLALIGQALALASKTTACTLPAALLLVLWLQHKPIRWLRLAQIVPFLVMGVGMGVLTIWWERYHQGTQGDLFALGLPERLLVASHAFWFYLGKLIWPVNLMFSYPRWTINPADPFAYGWAVACLGLGWVIYFLRRFAGRSLEVAALFYVLTLSPLMGFIMLYTFLYTFVADHYQYAACIGPIALAAAGIVRALEFFGKGKLLLKPVICGALLFTLGVLTWRQCGMYADIETLWRTTIQRNPDSWMAYNNLGTDLESKGKLDGAIQQFQEAIRLRPDYAEAYNNLGATLESKDQIDGAIRQLQEAIRLKPDYPDAFYNLGNAFGKKGEDDKAIHQYQEAIRLKPDYAMAHNNLGNVFDKKGQVDEAIDQYQEAIRQKPDFALAHNNLGNALAKKDQVDEAIEQFQEAVRLKPDYADTHLNLAIALDKKGQVDEAIRHYQEAIRLKPDDVHARYNLGIDLNTEGKIDEAIIQFQEVVRLKPDYAEVYNNLGAIFASKGRLDEAIRQFQEAVRLKPDEAGIRNNLGMVLGMAGQLDEAIRQFQEVIRLKPDFAGASNNLVRVLRMKNAPASH